MLISLRSVLTWFGSHNCARVLSFIQFVPSGCHAMPRMHCIAVEVFFAGKYPPEFEVKGISPSSAVIENAWKYISDPH